MKTFLLSLFFLTGFFSQSQTIERYYDAFGKLTSNPSDSRFYSVTTYKDSFWHTSEFYIYEKTLHMKGSYKDSSLQIKHGEFTWFHPNGYLEKKGRYDHNNYAGTWVSYHSNGIISDSSTYVNGNKSGVSLSWHYNGYISDSILTYADGSRVIVQWFDNGIPSAAGRVNAKGRMIGKWQFFHKNGKLSALEIYDNGLLVTREYYDENGTALDHNVDREREAEFPGGSKAWSKFINKNIYWPSQLKFQAPGTAVVLVRFAVNEEGEVVDAHVSLPLHPEFDKIALKAVKKSPKWIPAISHNRTIKVYRTQSIGFVQPD